MAAAAHIAHIKVRSQNSFHLDVTREMASLEGHLFALPILFINLGGEMIYVIEHRLRAQKLDDKLEKVMHDVIGTIFRPRIIDELFKPQHLLSEASMRSLFQKLAHASIMSLNQESMDKLLDLMSMAVKYQIFACSYPTELIYCTLNHLDYMREMVKTIDSMSNSLRKVYSYIDKTYCRMDTQNLVLLRNTILRYFQDRKTRLSVFLSNGIQREIDGVLKVPREFQISPTSHVHLPGTVTYFKTVKGVMSTETSENRTEHFHPGGHFTMAPPITQTTIFDTPLGHRGTTLGMNIFAAYKGINVTAPAAALPAAARRLSAQQPPSAAAAEIAATREATGAAEVDMLARILGGITDIDEKRVMNFELDFLEEDADGVAGGLPAEYNLPPLTLPVKRIAVAEMKKVELSKNKMADIDIGVAAPVGKDDAEQKPDEMDILALMDNAAGK
ncbi:protein OSCP1-like [Paramacrobiotus metropolitanus]|uniref:protein OSCP1-like n=1 Tax=Paramacrobiotus metropolitanus TaxID=2943436 RepID=UPI002445A8C1|nr:protein OSCP1-like [Paramacrobiotus metropolitanus]